MLKKPKKGEIAPTADSHETPITTITSPVAVAVAIEYTEVKSQSEMIAKLDELLIETEARSTIYYAALGLIAKQALGKLRLLHPESSQVELLTSFINSLHLSESRSVRSIQRYMELVQYMVDDGTLTGVLTDALRAANFSDEIKTEVLKVTDGKCFTDLCAKYGMLRDKKVKKAKANRNTTLVPVVTENSPIEDQIQAVIDQIEDGFKRAAELFPKAHELIQFGKIEAEKITPLFSKRVSLTTAYDQFRQAMEQLDGRLALPRTQADLKTLLPGQPVVVAR